MRVSTAHFTILMVMRMVGLFHSVAYARFNNSQQMERMKVNLMPLLLRVISTKQKKYGAALTASSAMLIEIK